MITQSGRLVMPDNGVNPSIEDIAHGLARIHRFGGQYDRGVTWTVAHHSLACEAMARADGAVQSTAFAALTHDFHEVLTGDVTYHWKTTDVRERQREIDIRLGLALVNRFTQLYVKEIDDRALWAESFVLHPKAFGPSLGRGDVSAKLPADVKIVRNLLALGNVAQTLNAAILQYPKDLPFFKAVE